MWCCIHRCPPQPAFQVGVSQPCAACLGDFFAWFLERLDVSTVQRMVSEGRKIKALWDANKDVLMGMVLGSLANIGTIDPK